jgi:rfaE bifunctional protein kinase chain/domain/rfaE bifunctional protein nucleotidyltransferase chain/domain
MKKEFKNHYSQKIVTLKGLEKILGKRPRKKKVILCHGNFDVVHPGHVRHLIYAKSKADLLIVSITADKYIQKGVYRPFVPENLRALNLAAFEMVDYVTIDDNKTSIRILKNLKPDFFAKGFEYSSGELPPATQEEAKVVEKYGGEMIFTPGDIVYSSTKLLNLSKPKIDNYKILDLMERNKVSFNNLRETLKKIKKLKVHVIGDTIIDTHTKTNLIGGYLKTPTPSVLYQETKDYTGGAAIVAKHLKKAGAKVCFTTILGNDKLKDFVIDEMKKSKIKLNFIVDKTRPTTNKNTIMTTGYNLLKIDKVDNQPISGSILNRIKDIIFKEKADIVIFSDFRHGIFNKSSIPILTAAIKKGIFKVADSQVATRWGNITDFKNFDLVTPNEKEARFSLADQDSSISSMTLELDKKINCKNLILKLGGRGLFAKGKSNRNGFALPSFTKRIVDAVGAGDALLAYSSLALRATKSILISSILGSLAASCECEKDGNIEIDPNEMNQKIKNLEESANYSVTSKL